MGCASSKEDAPENAVRSKANGMLKSSLNPVVHLQNMLHVPQNKLQKAGREGAHHLKNIFAMPLEAFDAATYRPPHHSKTDLEEIFIRKALAKNFVFEDLEKHRLTPLVGAFQKTTFDKSDTIIKQGDEGDYLYVLYDGKCDYVVDGKVVGQAKPGHTFGELALLYTCPRAATVVATESVTLFRVDQKSFRYILQAQTQQAVSAKVKLLQDVEFLQNLSPNVTSKLASAMQARPFSKGELIVKKGGDKVAFYVVEKGELLVKDLGDGDTTFEDVTLSPGEHFGERAVVTGRAPAGNVIAQTDGQLFTIDRDTMHAVIGDLQTAVLRSIDKKCLEGIKVFKDTHLDSATLSSLARLIKDIHLEKGDHIMKEGAETESALYIIRSGKIQQNYSKAAKKNVLETGGYFGDQMLTLDAEQGKSGPNDPTTVDAPYSVKVLEKCEVGVLKLKDCRVLFDTRFIGKGEAAFSGAFLGKTLSLSDFEKHTVLGAGTFGQVWLVSQDDPLDGKQAYALKVQSKYELVKGGQAKAVINEKSIMAQMHHPLITNLAGTFKDENFVYMVMGLVQGGELFSIMHSETSDKMSEKDAKFYVGGIAEAVGYMHRRGFAFRDLKPENVMISTKGYPVIVDFGFAKYVSDLTYTLCGTPLYLPPEVILNRGHNWGCDHWSLGVMFYEMIDGDTPFYVSGMDQMELFRAIVKGKYRALPNLSDPAATLMKGLLQRDPRKRLGCLAGGEDDIMSHPFFTDLDFAKLRNMEYGAPMVPNIKDPLDSSKFEKWDHLEDKLATKYPKIEAADARIFDAF